MAFLAAWREEFWRATIWYFERPRGELRYWRWVLDAHDVLAEDERPMMAVRIGAMVGYFGIVKIIVCLLFQVKAFGVDFGGFYILG